MARQRKPQDHTKDRIALDVDGIEFIKLNAPYMTLNAMQTALQVSQETLMALVKASGADVSKEARAPRANEIAQDLRFLPLGTVVERTSRCTMIHLQSNIPGITRITRHYGFDDE